MDNGGGLQAGSLIAVDDNSRMSAVADWFLRGARDVLAGADQATRGADSVGAPSRPVIGVDATGQLYVQGAAAGQNVAGAPPGSVEKEGLPPLLILAAVVACVFLLR
jgi:hypothetical protein